MKYVIEKLKEEKNILLNKPYIERGKQLNIKDIMLSPLIKLITGPRRAGKSVFALQLLKNAEFAYLNFDNEQLLNEFDEDKVEQALEEVYPKYKYLMLDEIQNLSSWDLWVSKLYRRGVNIVMTGSNAKLLSSEMATVLTGRYLMIEILPFSFSEVLTYRNTEFSDATPTQKANMALLMDEYLVNGGFPETLALRSITQNYLSTLFDSILLKDITKRFRVRQSTELYNLASYLLTNYTNPLTYTGLAEDLNFSSKTTLQKFIGYLTETYIYYLLPRFNNKLKLMQKAAFKLYVIDNGFITARSFDLSPNRGRLLENLVFIELIRRGYKSGLSLFYFKTKRDKEIDFVCKNGFTITDLIQVSYDISNPKTLNREISALKEAAVELKCNNMLLITASNHPVESIEGVQIISILNWLKNSEKEICHWKFGDSV